MRADKRPNFKKSSPVAVIALAGLIAALPANAETLLEKGFKIPPQPARPQVWWHWIDGNVDEAGAQRDLAWMKSVGIGGVHIFSGGGFGRPAVDKPELFMSPEWKNAFSSSVRTAVADGMDVVIAGSPGWSETGGTWVQPSDGMKKYVWSVTQVDGDVKGPILLPPPPAATGPFQAVKRAAPKGVSQPEAYGDSLVIAFRTPELEGGAAKPIFSVGSGPVDFADGAVSGSLVKVPLVPGGETAEIVAAYPAPATIGALELGVAEKVDISIWSSDDGVNWSPVSQVHGTDVEHPAPQQTIGFQPKTASFFKIQLKLQPPDRPLSGFPSGTPRRPASLTISRFELVAGARVNRFETKAGFEATGNFESIETPQVPSGYTVDQNTVIDLTSHFRADAGLDWEAPPGKWTVLRIGWSLTGQTNGPAEPAATGLEVDKLNPDAVHRYIEHYLSLYSATVDGKLGPGGIDGLLTDSWEAGVQNWTPTLLAQFRSRRGYDPLPYLPVLAGYVVGGAAESDKFLFDFRLTLKETLADNHYGVLAQVMHDHHMTYYTEASGDTPRVIGDGMTLKARADIPTGELWYRSFATAPGQPSLQADLMEAASAGHVYGKPIVAAESLTVAAATDPWSFSPRMLKPVVDRIFGLGVNRILYHDSMHQPFADKKPGLAMMIFGQYFNRNETWAPEAGAWIDYLSRTSYMLQQGRFVADIAYYYGEEQTLTDQSLEHFDFKVPDGYHFDFLNPEGLEKVVEAREGRLVTPSGASYAVLYISPTVTRFSLPAIKRLRDLVRQGAVVVGRRPLGSLGLEGSDAQVMAVADEIWGSSSSTPAVRVVGKGRVFTSDLNFALNSLGIEPDSAIAAGGEVLTVHRRMPGADIYYLSNQSGKAQTFSARFRVTGKAARLWDATTGETTETLYRQDRHVTQVPLTLMPDQSTFVVFDRSSRQKAYTVPAVSEHAVTTLAGPWHVSFEAGRGAPESTEFSQLIDWSKSNNPGVKYFSGKATYNTSFLLGGPAVRGNDCYRLDLGSVYELATVKVNGKEVATVWHSPYQVQLRHLLKVGDNSIEISVVNLWPNRLIGDKQPGALKIAYAPASPYRADSALLPSGLLGPVRILATTCR